MSYDITFKVKVDGIDRYVPVGDCEANITWNVRKIIKLSTGLPWLNEENNGFCKDVIPKIADGLAELHKNPGKYKPYEAENGWGTVEDTKRFFNQILEDWEYLREEYGDEIANVTTFWIE